jgi:hypothetical protein
MKILNCVAYMLHGKSLVPENLPKNLNGWQQLTLNGWKNNTIVAENFDPPIIIVLSHANKCW